MFVIVVVIVVVSSPSDATNDLRLPDWSEMRNLEAVLSLTLLAPICLPSVFVSRLCQKLCSKSAIIVKKGEATGTFHRI